MHARHPFPARLAGALLLAALLAGPGAHAQQLVAQRPDQSAVPPGTPMFLDGFWRLPDGRRFKFEGGRIIALSDYVDIMWKVKKGMVIVQDIRQDGPRSFTGHDPGWNIRWTGELDDQGRLDGTWHGLTGPVSFTFTADMLANPAWFQQAMSGYQQGYQPPGYGSQPGYGGQPGYYPPPAYGAPQPGYPPPGYPPPGHGGQPGYPQPGYPPPQMQPTPGGTCAQTVYDVSRGHYVCVQ